MFNYLVTISMLSLSLQCLQAEEAAIEENAVILSDEADESGWMLVSTDQYTARFPMVPKVDRRAGVTTYTSLDAGTFPVVLYMLTVTESKSALAEAEAEVNNYLEKMSAYPSNLLHHEVAESEEEIVVDTLSSDARTRVFRCERMIIGKDAVYTLTTLFFANSAENHDHFISHFVRAY